MQSRQKGFSVAGKMAAGAMLLVIISVGVTSYMGLHRQTEALEAAERRTADLLTSAVAVLAQNDLYTGDRANLGATTRLLRKNNPRLLWIAIYNQEGELFAQHPLDGPPPEANKIEPIVREIKPVKDSDFSFGEIRLVFDRSEIEAAKDTVRETTLTVALVLLVATFIAALAWASYFSKPITRLAEASKQVSDGDLTVRVPPAGKDEIGELTVRFNEMVGNLETSRANLEKTLNELSTLYSVSRIINTTSEREQILKLNIETLATGFKFTPVVILLEINHEWIVAARQDPESKSVITDEGSLEKTPADLGVDLALSSGTAVSVDPSLMPNGWGFGGAPAESVYAVPLLSGSTVVGLLIAGNADQDDAKQILGVVASQISPPVLISLLAEKEQQKISDPFSYVSASLLETINKAREFGVDVTLFLFSFEASAWEKGAEEIDERFEAIQSIVETALPEADLIARYTANRLLVVAPGYSKKEGRALLMKIDLPWFEELRTELVSFPDDGEHPSQLLALAEGATKA